MFNPDKVDVQPKYYSRITFKLKYFHMKYNLLQTITKQGKLIKHLVQNVKALVAMFSLNSVFHFDRFHLKMTFIQIKLQNFDTMPAS